MLRMHEGQIEELAQIVRDAQIGASGDGAVGDVARHRIAGIALWVAAEHVAGKLVEHDGKRQRATIALLPCLKLSGRRIAPEVEITVADLRVEGIVAAVPTIGARLAPERQNVSRRDVASLGHGRASIRPCRQAAAFFSSRSWRRRIFPTLVFGSSVLNSMCLGTL